MSDEFAAARRADYLRALREEREGYIRRGRSTADVDEAIARMEGGPVGRSESEPKPRPRKRAAR